MDFDDTIFMFSKESLWLNKYTRMAIENKITQLLTG